MHVVPSEIPPPKNESDFERMCAKIYGVVFKDPTPKINGRKGQSQGGVDVFVNAEGIGRIGIQCKKYFLTTLTWDDVTDEVRRADEKKMPIKRLLVATTSPSNATLLQMVQALSDERSAKGLFTIEVEFWEDIENRINAHVVLQDSYTPQSPGAAYHRQQQANERIIEIGLKTSERITALEVFPKGRDDSLNKTISAQLDQTNVFLKENRYRDGLAHIDAIGHDLSLFDAHQKARWHLQRGLCLWFTGPNVKEAAELFLKAADLYPNDERMASARIRGLLLNRKIDEALSAGKLAIEQFPTSKQVRHTYINAVMERGDIVSLDDIPSTMRDEPEILQILAIAARKHNNYSEAVRLALKATAHQEAGYFTRATALGMVIEDVARNPVAAMHGLLSKKRLETLNQTIAMFEPRQEKLWSVQSDTVEETASQLGFAYLMRCEPKGALEIVKEASVHGVNSKNLFRVHLQALSELGLEDEVFELWKNRPTDITPESVIVVAELAAKRGDIKFMEEAETLARSWPIENRNLKDILTAIRWESFVSTGDKESAFSEIANAKLATTSNFILVSAAARLLSASGKLLEADPLIERAQSLIDGDSTESQRLMLADLLFGVKRWVEAAALYEQFTPPSLLSDLHAKLLNCYIETESRKKAKDFLNQLPDNWVENDTIRQLAINLGQKAGDWAFLSPLADSQLKKAPTEAASWLFKLVVARQDETPAAFQELVRRTPEIINGSIQNIARLAALELRYDEHAKGLRRLYRLVRQNFDEPESFAAYLINTAVVPTNLPLMEEALPLGAAGASFTLINDECRELQVVIDPSDIETLPKKEGFLSSDSPQAEALMGIEVGKKVAIPSLSFGGIENYVVKSIQSAYRRLVHIAQERAAALGGLPYLKSVSMGTSGDPTKDLSHIYTEITRHAEVSRQIFEAYGAGQLTLSGLATMLGRSPVKIVAEWPNDAPPIFVGTGLEQERDAALEALSRSDAIYVTDSLTLTELVKLGVSDVLGALPKIYISPVTMEVLKNNLLDAEEDKSVGSAMDVDGQLRFLEYDDKYRLRIITFAKELVDVAKRFCEVKPAYAELNLAIEGREISNILNAEEREMLFLAKGSNATLLTLDGRLRTLARIGGVELSGVWPQVLIQHCLKTGLMTPAKSAEFTIKQFLTNRKFISISSTDLVWMVFQGGAYLQSGIQTLKQYLASSDTDFESSSRVVLDFLAAIARMNIQLGAFGELLVHVIEPLLRRKDCPASFYETVCKEMTVLIKDASGEPYIYPPANSWRDRKVLVQLEFLAGKIVETRNRSSGSFEMRPVAVRALFCCNIPKLILDESVSVRATDDLV